jgi:alpha-mannosidase
VTVTMENSSKNHRVEVRVPTGIASDHVQVDGAFCTTRRASHFYQTAAMHRFIDVNDGKAGLSVLSKGIHEYNLDKDQHGGLIVDLTLLRCVGVLAGHHIGNRWPANSVPAAQVPGPTIVEFALASHDGDAISGNVHRLGGEFCNPPRAIEPLEHLYLRGKCQKTLPAGEHSFVQLSPPQLVLSVFYKDDLGDKVYLRFYNAAYAPCEARLDVQLGRPLRAVVLVDMNGIALADQQHLQHEGCKISLKCRQAQIVTIAMTFAGNT